MKNYIILISILMFILLCLSCEKMLNTADCDINGYWIGTWESGTDLGGTFVAGLEQDKSAFGGIVGIQILTDSKEGYYTDIEGRISGSELRSVIYISTVDISVEGEVREDQFMEGTFNVPALQLSGTWSGGTLSSSRPVITEIYSFTPEDFGESITDILCIEDELWIFMYPYEYIGDEAMLKVIITDLEGNVSSTSYFPYEGYGYTYDGQFIWTIYNGSTLVKYNVDGTPEGRFDCPVNTFHVTGNGNNLYFPTYSYGIVKTDMDLNIVDTIPFNYLSEDGLILYNNNFLTFSSETLFKSDMQGNPLCAYPLNNDEYVSKLVTNDDVVFSLVANYDYESQGQGTTSFIIYRIDPESGN